MTFKARLKHLQQRFPNLQIVLRNPSDKAARITYASAGCHIEGWLYENGSCRFELVAINSAECAEQLLEIVHAIQG
jgi:hypothetical protein